MVNYILFLDVLRQEEIEKFYKACQLHREFYKRYSKSPHPLDYFNESPYKWQCPPEISPIYLSFPPYHIKYKSPAALPTSTGRTIDIPALPHRSLAGRFNKSACKAFIR